MRSGRAVAQPFHAFRVEPIDPFGHDLGRYVELARGRSLAQAAFGYTAHHRLSTFGRQRRILVAVHLVSPWNTEASQPQLPRFRPDGQPPERPHLEHDGLKLKIASPRRQALTASCPARGTSLSGTQNCENNPMQSRNRASHYPKTQDLVARIGASGREKNAAHLARPPTSSHPALVHTAPGLAAAEHAAEGAALDPQAVRALQRDR